MITTQELQEIINRFDPSVKVTLLPKFREEVRYSIDFVNGLSIFITPEGIDMDDDPKDKLWIRANNKLIVISKYNSHVIL
jgi:hypothetical protein